jgi:hypothetical protein
MFEIVTFSMTEFETLVKKIPAPFRWFAIPVPFAVA